MAKAIPRKNRVVITGLNTANPLGLSVSETWQALISGKSGVDYISLFDPAPFETKIAAEVKDFRITDYISRKDGRHMDRFTQFAVAAKPASY